jgi:hypothetical protein
MTLIIVTLSIRTFSIRTFGKMTLNITTLSIVTLSMVTLSIVTLSIRTLGIRTFSIRTFIKMTLSITTHSIVTLSASIKGLFVTLSIIALCHYPEFCVLHIVMLIVIILNVSVPNFVMIIVVMLSVVVLNVIILSVVVPSKQIHLKINVNYFSCGLLSSPVFKRARNDQAFRGTTLNINRIRGRTWGGVEGINERNDLLLQNFDGSFQGVKPGFELIRLFSSVGDKSKNKLERLSLPGP